MVSYHVFFSPKPGIGDDSAVGTVRRFLDHLHSEGRLQRYRIFRMTSPTTFDGLPRFQLIVDYESEQACEESFAFMRRAERYKEGPHGELLRMVSDFRVSFSVDA